MQTITATRPIVQEFDDLLGVEGRRGQPILVATDGRMQSDGALAAAQLIAGHETTVNAVAVLEPMPIVSPEVQLPVTPELLAGRRAALQDEVEAQVARVSTFAEPWSVEIREGDPPGQISRAAEEMEARLIVVGLGRHRILDRIFGDETALRLLRVARVPVLAVTPAYTAPPRRAIVAVDFSETSVRAAIEALELVAEGGTLYLAHVVPRAVTASVWDSFDSTYRRDVAAEWDKLLREVRPTRGIRLEQVLLEGDPAAEILGFARQVDAELIATGSHGHGFITRLLVGGVATKLLRGSVCSVLAVPPHPSARPVRSSNVSRAAAARVPLYEWTHMLDQFSMRNIGRRGVLEVDDPEIGAQAQERDYPFLGATYDHHDARVELMFGELGYDGRHLSRSIGDIQSIDILQDELGRDLALRIAHGAGQTLLTFSW